MVVQVDQHQHCIFIVPAGLCTSEQILQRIGLSQIHVEELINLPTNDQVRTTIVWMVIQDDGFQIKALLPTTNANNGKYIYAAYADIWKQLDTYNNFVSDAGLETASKGFDVVSYTGTGSSQTIDLCNSEPDTIRVKTTSRC